MFEIVYSMEALYYPDELNFVLLDNEYFSFEDTSIEYVRDIRYFIKTKITTAPKKKAPDAFSKISAGLKNITCKRNKNTTGYIFFILKDNRYLIEHITNNDVAAEHIKGL